MAGKVYQFDPNVTMNMDSGDAFHCMVCNHYTDFESATMWADSGYDHTCYWHMHGSEPFNYCPHCGANVLTPEEWAMRFPCDVGKTIGEIARRYR